MKTIALLFVAVAALAVGPGSAAPDFSLMDQNGKKVSLSDYKGKIVVLEWFNEGCPYVQRHYKNGEMNTLAGKYAAKDVVWLAINTNSKKKAEDNKKIAESWKMDRPILLDGDGQVAKAYHAKTTPHMFIINTDGKVVYSGAIDNDPDNKKGDKRVNYVAKALDELLAGKTVSEPETKPYGCGVKYPR